MSALRVLIAEDHPLMMSGIRDALTGHPDIEIVAEAGTGAEVLPLAAHTAPDLILLDLRLPEMDGLTVLQRLRERHPQMKVAVLSAVNDPTEIARALEGGACAYIVKGIDSADLAPVIRQAVSGTVYAVSGLVRESSEHEQNAAGLSHRELEVLQAVARGLSNRAIARELWLSDQTVKFHLHNIYRKLGVSNRTEAAMCAFEHGYAEAPA